MGTAALSVVLFNEGQAWQATWLNPIAAAVLIAATALAVALVPRYVGRLLHLDALRAEIADPSAGPMLGTFPAGTLLLGVAWGAVGPLLVGTTIALWLDAILLTLGILLALGLSITWVALTIRSGVGLASVHGGWLIPPLMNLLIPLAIAPLAFANPGHAAALILIGLTFLGIGAFLFLAVFTLIFARLAMCSPAPAAAAPSLWIPLAPAGLLGVATLRLLQAGVPGGLWGPQFVLIGLAIAVMGIGFGLWWAALALVELMRLRRAGGVPFHIGWWSFVFPTAAMALSIGAVGDATGLMPLKVMGAVAAFTLACVWALVATRTIRAALNQRMHEAQ